MNRRRVAPYVDRLLKADALVFSFPVWNMGFPAILKGFVDKVFLPGVSFNHDGRRRLRAFPAQHQAARRGLAAMGARGRIHGSVTASGGRSLHLTHLDYEPDDQRRQNENGSGRAEDAARATHVEDGAAEGGPERDRELDRRHHQAAAAFRLVGNRASEPGRPRHRDSAEGETPERHHRRIHNDRPARD